MKHESVLISVLKVKLIDQQPIGIMFKSSRVIIIQYMFSPYIFLFMLSLFKMIQSEVKCLISDEFAVSP